MALLTVNNLKKSFGNTQVLKGVSFSLERGQALAIIGSSGSGKTTLLRCLNFLEMPDEGNIMIGDKVLIEGGSGIALDDESIRQNRLHFGLVFQNFNLFPQYTALENVKLAPTLLKKGTAEQIDETARKLLDQVGLSEKLGNYPYQLSGGQQQRVALARTLNQNPKIILADEPVASLDPITAKQVMEDFVRINKEYKISILLNIHHVDLALKYCDRVIGIRAGEIVFDGPASTITQEQIDEVYNGTKVPTMGDGE